MPINRVCSRPPRKSSRGCSSLVSCARIRSCTALAFSAVDASAPSRRVYAGYFLTSYLSFEAGYTGLLKSNEVTDPLFDTDVTLRGSVYDAQVRPTLPLGRRFELFGMVGYSWYDWKIGQEDLDQIPVTDRIKGRDWHYGLGGAWKLSKRWTIRAEWTQIDQTDAEFNLFTASASYSFR